MQLYIRADYSNEITPRAMGRSTAKNDAMTHVEIVAKEK